MDYEEVALDPWRGVYMALRQAILDGEFAPGVRLVEQQLADRFGTSRGPIRTALQELERTGLVVSIDRRGSFVRSLSEADLEEIFSLAEILNDFAVRRAVARMGPADREWLADFKTRATEATTPSEELALQTELGRQIFRIAQHTRALEIFESLLLQASWQALFTRALDRMEQWHEQAAFDVGAYCDALLRGDADEVMRLGRRMLEAVRSHAVDAETGQLLT